MAASGARQRALNLHSLDESLINGLAEQLDESIDEVTQEGFDYEVPDGVIPRQQTHFPMVTRARWARQTDSEGSRCR